MDGHGKKKRMQLFLIKRTCNCQRLQQLRQRALYLYNLLSLTIVLIEKRQAHRLSTFMGVGVGVAGVERGENPTPKLTSDNSINATNADSFIFQDAPSKTAEMALRKN